MNMSSNKIISSNQFFYSIKTNFPLWLNKMPYRQIFLIYASVTGDLDLVHFLAIINNTAKTQTFKYFCGG